MTAIKRKIIIIDEEKCTGCGLCVPSCPEQAIEIVDTEKGKKARLVKEFYCDGLGACLGSCPEDAIKIEEKEVEPYNEEATIARIKEVAPQVLETHLKHMAEHAHHLPEHHSHKMPEGVVGCPSAQVMSWDKESGVESSDSLDGTKVPTPSELHQWPIQLHLVPPHAPYFKGADIVLVADCVPFAYANFHTDFLKDKAIAIACPKLDDIEPYYEKIQQIIEIAHPKSIEVVYMEVPCCFGLVQIVKEAIKRSKKNIPLKETTISIKGEIIN